MLRTVIMGMGVFFLFFFGGKGGRGKYLMSDVCLICSDLSVCGYIYLLCRNAIQSVHYYALPAVRILYIYGGNINIIHYYSIPLCLNRASPSPLLLLFQSNYSLHRHDTTRHGFTPQWGSRACTRTSGRTPAPSPSRPPCPHSPHTPHHSSSTAPVSHTTSTSAARTPPPPQTHGNPRYPTANSKPQS